MQHDPDPALRRTPLAPSPGTTLDAAQVLGRDRDVERALLMLESVSLRLNEPRRLGKTSFLTRLADQAPEGWVVVAQSYQGVTTTAGLVERALSGIANHRRMRLKAASAAKAFLSSAKPKVATPDGFVFELAPSFRDDPLQALVAGLTSVSRNLGPREHLVLAWDEVPDMVKAIGDSEGVEAATAALALMRRLREEFARSGDRIRWILTGSVGFHHLLREMGRDDLVNDLENLPLGPLDDAWTEHLAERLLRGAGIDPDEASVVELARISGGIPVVAHLVCSHLKSDQAQSIRAGQLQAVFELVVSNLDESHQFTSFLTRLNSYYDGCRDGAAWLLDQLAASPASRAELWAAIPRDRSIESEEQLREVLGWLEADHYLHRTGASGEAFAWRYEPLRQIWEVRRR